MLITSDPAILNCVHFLFIILILHDSNRTKEEWDSHIISKCKTGDQVEGHHVFIPHLYGVQDFLHNTDLEEVQEFRGVVNSVPDTEFSMDFHKFVEYLLEEDGREPPSNPTDSLNLYTYLLQKIEEYSQWLRKIS